MSTARLRMEAITKRFAGVVALKNVTLEAYPGEIVGLIGENGAGKSTLMKILSGVWPVGAYEGHVYIDGRERPFASPHESELAGIAMIYQESHLLQDLNVMENILLGHLPHARFGWVDWPVARTKAKQLLDRLGIKIAPDENTKRLSASQQQMVAIAKALGRNASILVLDEPTATLTEAETETLFAVLRKLRSEGVTCIYISHRLEEVLDLADRVTVLRDGEVVDTLEVTPLLGQAELVRLMVGRSLTDMYPKSTVPIGPPVLRVQNLSLEHPFIEGRRLLKDISFEVHRGEILGIGGLVGSGRSEIVTSLFGLNGKRATAKVWMCGEEITISSPLDAKRHHLGLLTEDRRANGLIVSFPISENVTLASLETISRRGILNFAKERQLAEQQVHRLNIRAPSIQTLVNNLSGGNQQKVILAKWLLTDLKVLFLDEPTQGIDVGAKVEIYKTMESLVKQGLAIVWISSELPELLAMSDRILVLADGQNKGILSRYEATPERVMHLATDFGSKLDSDTPAFGST